MKIKNILAIVALSLTSSAFSANILSVPFINQLVNGVESQGLLLQYNMRTSPLPEVVCTLANFTKGVITYTDGNVVKKSRQISGAHTAIFTSRGRTMAITDTLDQYHIDINSDIVINHTETDRLNSSFASCFYIPDTNVVTSHAR